MIKNDQQDKRHPKISVVIPTYNRAHLLPECLQSVLAQSFQDLEIIVVDDGSIDNTREVVSSFPVRYCYQENQGPAAARNRGVGLARGEYVAFLDSDDLLAKDSLKMSVEVLDKHPEVGFSYGQAYQTDHKGYVFGLENTGSIHSAIREGSEEIRRFLISGNHITLSTVVARRSCLNTVGLFDTGFRSGSEDLDLWMRLSKKYAVAYIAEPLAKYRLHPQKFCSGRTLEEWEQTNSLILESIFNDEELGSSFSSLRRRAYFVLFSNFANRAHFRGDAKNCRHYLWKALSTDPLFLFGKGGLRLACKFTVYLLPYRLWLAASRLRWYLGGSKRVTEST